MQTSNDAIMGWKSGMARRYALSNLYGIYLSSVEMTVRYVAASDGRLGSELQSPRGEPNVETCYFRTTKGQDTQVLRCNYSGRLLFLKDVTMHAKILT